MAPLTQAGPGALMTLQEVLRQVRAIASLREKRPGAFHLLGQPYLQFGEADGKLQAELRKLSGTGFDRYPVDTVPEQRRFVDEAKRRAAKLGDE